LLRLHASFLRYWGDRGVQGLTTYTPMYSC